MYTGKSGSFHAGYLFIASYKHGLFSCIELPESGQYAVEEVYVERKPMTMIRKSVIPMTEKPGHFEKGLWVEDHAPSSPQAVGDAIDKRLAEATKAVISSIDNVMSVTHDLVATDEGKQFIETTIKDTQKQIQLSFDAIISRAKAELEKTKAELDKKVKK
jgi:hypothetical protein